MQVYYAVRAGEYELIYRKHERQTDLRQMEAWLAGMLAGRSVLEIACGTGYWTPFYASHATRVLGIDSAKETLQIARTRLPVEHFPQVQLDIGDAYQPPANDASGQPFSAAFAGF